MSQRPARVFIVRHGERTDHIDPQYHIGNVRPHDSPLTEAGKHMAYLLGKHLATKRSVKPAYVSTTTSESDDSSVLYASNVVVLTSPLQRCVETSHGICNGLVEASSVPKGSIIPMYLETGIMEGPQWLNYDVEKARQIKREHLALKNGAVCTVHKEANISPVIQSFEALKAIVGTEHLMAPSKPPTTEGGLPGVHPTTGSCMVPTTLIAHPRQNADQRVYNNINHRAKSRHSEVENDPAALEAFQSEHIIHEHGEVAKYVCRGLVHERTEELARLVANSELFAGMDVILVGHGETTALVNNSFPDLCKTCEFHGSPYYTAWTELVHKDGKWKTAEGVTPFKTPHLEEAGVDTDKSGTG